MQARHHWEIINACWLGHLTTTWTYSQRIWAQSSVKTSCWHIVLKEPYSLPQGQMQRPCIVSVAMVIPCIPFSHIFRQHPLVHLRPLHAIPRKGVDLSLGKHPGPWSGRHPTPRALTFGTLHARNTTTKVSVVLVEDDVHSLVLLSVPIYDGRRNDKKDRDGFLMDAEGLADSLSDLAEGRLPRYLNSITDNNVPSSGPDEYYVVLVGFTASAYKPAKADDMDLDPRQISLNAMFLIILGHCVVPGSSSPTSSSPTKQQFLLSPVTDEITPMYISSLQSQLYGPPDYVDVSGPTDDHTYALTYVDDEAEEEDDEQAEEEEEEEDFQQEGEVTTTNTILEEDAGKEEEEDDDEGVEEEFEFVEEEDAEEEA